MKIDSLDISEENAKKALDFLLKKAGIKKASIAQDGAIVFMKDFKHHFLHMQYLRLVLVK